MSDTLLLLLYLIGLWTIGKFLLRHIPIWELLAFVAGWVLSKWHEKRLDKR